MEPYQRTLFSKLPWSYIRGFFGPVRDFLASFKVHFFQIGARLQFDVTHSANGQPLNFLGTTYLGGPFKHVLFSSLFGEMVMVFKWV